MDVCATRRADARRSKISQHFLWIEAYDPAFPLVVVRLILGRYSKRIAAPHGPYSTFRQTTQVGIGRRIEKHWLACEGPFRRILNVNLRDIFLLATESRIGPTPLVLLLQQPVELIPKGRRHFGSTCGGRTERSQLAQFMSTRLFPLRRLLAEKFCNVAQVKFLLRVGRLVSRLWSGRDLWFFLLRIALK